ncbi:hypothetical protein JCM10213_001829 [Rhodosporidiobolus nylandii]
MPPSGYGPSFSLCLISQLPVPRALDPPRVRVVGRIVGTDHARSLVLLEDEGRVVALDTELAVRAGAEPARAKERWMVWAEVAEVETPSTLPPISVTLPAAGPPSIDARVVLKALRMVQCEELDLVEWREGVRGMQHLRAYPTAGEGGRREVWVLSASLDGTLRRWKWPDLLNEEWSKVVLFEVKEEGQKESLLTAEEEAELEALMADD